MMRQSLTILAFALLSVASARKMLTEGSSGLFHGEGTAYSDAVDNGIGFACSMRHFSPYVKTYFAAINSEQWDNGANCGRFASVRCVDDFCANHEWVKVMIVDKCPECKFGDLDLSIPAYNEVTGKWPHRLQFEWQWTEPEGDEIVGNIKMDLKDGSNEQWRAFYLSNSKFPLASVVIDGVELARQEFGFWTMSGQLGSAPHTLQLTGNNGESVTTTVDDLLGGGIDLGVQLGGSSDSTASAGK